MTYSDGWAAIHLETPARVPHSEQALTKHWGIIKEVTGLTADENSPQPVIDQASVALAKTLNFDFRPNTLLDAQVFGNVRTRVQESNNGEGSWRIDCPFRMPEEVLHFRFDRVFDQPDLSAWTEKFSADYAQRSKETPNLVNTTGVYVGPVTGMLEIFGWEMLLYAAGMDLAAFGQLANRYTTWVLPYFEALANAEAPVVLIHDDICWSNGPLFSPAWYSQYLFPNYKKLLAPLVEANKKILFSSAGNFTSFATHLVESGIHGFLFDTSVDLEILAEQYGQTHVLIGNANPRLLFNGSYQDIQTEVERCMRIGKRCPGYFMALGNDVPVNAPVENILFYIDSYEALSKR